MSWSIQPRAGKHQLRLTLPGLPKSIFKTFDTRPEAEGYRDDILSLHARGYTPADLLEYGETKADNASLNKVIKAYIERGSPAPSDIDLLGILAGELVQLKMGDLSYAWAESWVYDMKTRDHKPDGRRLHRRRVNLAPGTKAEDRKKTSAKLSVRFATLFDYAGVPALTEHDLRHEAICRWVLLRLPSGAWAFSDAEICKIMGWSSMGMMLLYASLRGEDLSARLI